MNVAIAAVKNSMKNNQGATIVEFAMVFPLFVVLMIGIIDFGRYFFVQHTVQYATREGTRLALVGGTLTDANGNRLSRVDSIIKEIRDTASLAVNPSDPSFVISIFPITADYLDPTGWETRKDAGNPGDYMRVRTQYKYEFLAPVIGRFFTGGASTIKAQATYRNELF